MAEREQAVAAREKAVKLREKDVDKDRRLLDKAAIVQVAKHDENNSQVERLKEMVQEELAQVRKQKLEQTKN